MFPLNLSSYDSLKSLQDISLTQFNNPQTLCKSVLTVETAHTGSQTLAVKLSDSHDKNRKKMTSMMEKNQMLRRGLYGFLDRHWHTFQSQGLFALASSSPVHPETSEQTRRLHDFLTLRTLQMEDDLRVLRRAAMLLRNLENYESFHREAAHLRTCGRQPRLPNMTDKRVAYDEYLAHIYTNNMPPDLRKVRRALVNDLCFARRWLLLTSSLTTEALLVCEEPLFKKL